MDETTPKGPKRRPWIKWALIASLGINFGLAGLMAGGLVGGSRDAPMPGGLTQFGRALPESYRHDLGREIRASRSDWSGMREELRAQRGDLAAALTAEPYDAAAVAAVLARGADLWDGLARRGTVMLLSQIDRMDPDERATYAETLLREKPEQDRPDRGRPEPGQN